MRRLFLRLLRIELVLVFLVIIAGSVVRMSGSGMGCPDWPKCFGLLIPPTEISQVEFQPNEIYAKSQMIVLNDTLWKAKADFKSTSEWERSDWEPYTKHDYAAFNATHTWIEYINRLLGALSGIPMLLIAILSLGFFKRFRIITLLALTALFMLGFVAWLGKLVVDGHLIPGQITIHMLGAMIIITLLLMMMVFLQRDVKKYLFEERELTGWMAFALVLTLTQIILGTQVREEIDVLYKTFDGGERESWIDQLSGSFYIHRSLSILLLLVNIHIWRKNKLAEQSVKMINLILFLLIMETVFGIVLAYASVPPFAQPIHLFLAIVIFSLQFYLWFHNRLARARDPESETFLSKLLENRKSPAFSSSMNKGLVEK